MENFDDQILLKGLDDPPITDLIEGWSFWIREIAPYVYKVEAESMEGKLLFGYGGSAKDALYDCVKKVKRKILVKGYILKIKRFFSW